MGISSHLGGAERSLLDFIKYYRKQSPSSSVSVLLPNDNGPLCAKLKNLNIETHTLPMPTSFYNASREHFLSSSFQALLAMPQFVFYLYKLSRFIKQHNITKIHSTGLKCHLILSLISIHYPGQIILHFRDILRSTSLKKFFLLYKRKRNLVWLANSKATAESLQPISAKVIFNGIDIQVFQPKRNRYLRDQFDLSDKTQLIGHLGVLARWKGQKEFLMALPKVISIFPHCHAFIIGDQIYETSGDPSYLMELKSLVEKLKLLKQLLLTLK